MSKERKKKSSPLSNIQTASVNLPVEERPEPHRVRFDRGYNHPDSILGIGVLLFVLVVICFNWRLFTAPIYEAGDFAANALQVQNAKHFREMLGNYSRFGFNHPGPAFFYVFALGEGLFYDLLHIVPAPYNAELLAVILLNGVFLFFLLQIFRSHCKGWLFIPLALACVSLFLYPLGYPNPGETMVSAWPPNWILLCFPVFVVSASSVVAGNWNRFPHFVVAGMMLVHAHMAQILFVSVLSLFALGIAVFRKWKRGRLAAAVKRHWRPLTLGFILFVVFLVPPLLELVIHKPNNLDHVRQYMTRYRGQDKTLKTSALYFVSFFTHLPDPENKLEAPGSSLQSVWNHNSYARIYWGLCLAMLACAVTTRLTLGRKLNFFLSYVLFEITLISAIFIFWGIKITGPMFAFNGYFFFSMQLLGLLVCAAILADAFSAVRHSASLPLTVAAALLLILVSPAVAGSPQNSPEVQTIFKGLIAKHPSDLSLIFEHDDWPLAVAIASRMKRAGLNYCVPGWGLMFGYDHECTGDDRLRISRGSPACDSPCTRIIAINDLTVDLLSNSSGSIHLPLVVGPESSLDLKVGFHGNEGAGRWTSAESEIVFPLSKGPHDLPPYTLEIGGIALPGRPVSILLNGVTLGRIAGSGLHRTRFTAAPNLLLWDKENSVKIVTKAAGPVNADPRQLGYFFQSLKIKSDRALQPGDPPEIEQTNNMQVGPPISGAVFQPGEGWKLDGQYSGIGRVQDGLMWGSWNGKDAGTGQMSSTAVEPQDGCLVLPVGHGPSLVGQKITVLDADLNKTLAVMPLAAGNGTWRMYQLEFERSIHRVRFLAEDAGSEWGQWLAVGQPRTCWKE